MEKFLSNLIIGILIIAVLALGAWGKLASDRFMFNLLMKEYQQGQK